MTAATVAMSDSSGLLGRVDVDRVAVDGQVGVHPDRTTCFLRELPEQAGGPGEQGEPAQELDRQAQVRERGTTDPRAVQRQPAAQHPLVGAADRFEQGEVRAFEALLPGDRYQPRGPWVEHLVHGVAEAGDVRALLAGASYRVEGQRVPPRLVRGEDRPLLEYG